MTRSIYAPFAVLTAALALGCGNSSSDTPSGGKAASGGSNAAGGSNSAGAGGSAATGGTTGGDGGSAAGTGGAGQGGSGTGRCAGLATAATGTAGMIDDFEDGNITLSANEGRVGTWLLVGDTGCTLAPSPLAPEAPVTATTANKSTKSLHVSGTACTSYGFSVTAPLVANPISATENWECSYDVSGYDGIYFWVTGTDAISVNVSVGMISTVPARVGGDGTCGQADGGEGGCYDAWMYTATVSNDWQLVSFKWGDLMQAGWSGKPIPWNSKIVSEIAFGVAGTDTTPKADLWIDNVGFFKGSAPTAAP